MAKRNYYNFGAIRGYYNYVSKEADPYALSDQSIVDLDIEEVIKVIDHTHSVIGLQYLYNRLRNLNPSASSLALLEKRITYFNKSRNSRLICEKALGQLSNSYNYDWPLIIFGDLPKKRWWFPYIKYLRWLTILLIFLAPFSPVAFVILVLVFGVNIGLHLWLLNRMDWFFKLISRLSKLANSAQKLAPQSLLNTDQTQLLASIELTKTLGEKADFLRVQHKMENEYAALFWNFLQLVMSLFLSGYWQYHKVIAHLENNRESIHQVFKFIGEIDLALSVLKLRQLHETAIPEFTDRVQQISFKALRHPLVSSCIPNDFSLDRKSLLLTGSNMSGKSTFIKAINLNIIIGQTLNTVFAKSMVAPKLDIATSINIADNIMSDTSYYMQEVETIGSMLEKSKSDRQYIFTIDEIFKGTNTIERISAAKAILEYLNQTDHIILISTHDIELTDMLNDEFDQYYFQEEVNDGALSFDYTIKKGKLQKKNAIKILELSGYPKEVITAALKNADTLDQ